MQLLSIDPVNENGVAAVRYVLDSEILRTDVQVAAASRAKSDVVMAEPGNPMHVASPRKAELWIVHVQPGDIVKKGQELFNVSIMKQEKAVTAPVDAMVRRVLKSADFKKTRVMVPVAEGELIVELEPVPERCPSCGTPVADRNARFCPHCGTRLERACA